MASSEGVRFRGVSLYMLSKLAFLSVLVGAPIVTKLEFQR